MLNNLEHSIQKIVADALSTIGNQIAQAVRQSLAAEIMGSSGGAAAVVVKRRPGRPPGSGNKSKAAAPAAAAAAPKGPGRRGKRRRISESELEAVLGVLRKHPHITSVQIQKEAGIDKKQAARVLNKLRETKKVALKGKRSGATYTAA